MRPTVKRTINKSVDKTKRDREKEKEKEKEFEVFLGGANKERVQDKRVMQGDKKAAPKEMKKWIAQPPPTKQEDEIEEDEMLHELQSLGQQELEFLRKSLLQPQSLLSTTQQNLFKKLSEAPDIGFNPHFSRCLSEDNEEIPEQGGQTDNSYEEDYDVEEKIDEEPQDIQIVVKQPQQQRKTVSLVKQKQQQKKEQKDQKDQKGRPISAAINNLPLQQQRNHQNPKLENQYATPQQPASIIKKINTNPFGSNVGGRPKSMVQQPTPTNATPAPTTNSTTLYPMTTKPVNLTLEGLISRIQGMDEEGQLKLMRVIDQLDNSFIFLDKSSEKTMKTYSQATSLKLNSNDSALLPSTVIVIQLLSTWGSSTMVGLTEIQLFDMQGALLKIPIGYLSLRGTQSLKPIDVLGNGKAMTTNAINMWLASLPESGCIEIEIRVPCDIEVRSVKLWNYNKSLIDSVKGVRDALIKLIKPNESPIEQRVTVKKGTGNEMDDFGTVVELGNQKSTLLQNTTIDQSQCQSKQYIKTEKPIEYQQQQQYRSVEQQYKSVEQYKQIDQSRIIEQAKQNDQTKTLEQSNYIEERVPSRRQRGPLVYNIFKEEERLGTAKSVKDNVMNPPPRQRGAILQTSHPEEEEELMTTLKNFNLNNAGRFHESETQQQRINNNEEDALDMFFKAQFETKQPIQQSIQQPKFQNEVIRVKQNDVKQTEVNAKLINQIISKNNAILYQQADEVVPLRITIPTLPSARYITIKVHSTWGDRHYVGLNGIELWDERGVPISVTQPRRQLKADPSDINVLTEYGGDPRTPDKLMDGVYLTQSDMHVWLAPYNSSQTNFIYIDLLEKRRISMMRIWNYNKSRTHSFRGVKEVSVLMDKLLVFKGIIRKAPGSMSFKTSQNEQLFELILFTDDPHEVSTTDWVNESFNDTMNKSTLNNSSQLPRPTTSSSGVFEKMIEGDIRPTTSARVSNLKKEVRQARQQDKEIEIKEQPIKAKMINVVGGTIVKCKQLAIIIHSTWQSNDPTCGGLTGIQVFDREGQQIKISASQIGAQQQNLLMEDNITTDESRMWMAQFNQGRRHSITINWAEEVAVAALKIWNYNKSPDDAYKGVKMISLQADSRLIQNVLLKRAPGVDLYDYGQLITFITTALSQPNNQNVPRAPLQDYETFAYPQGFDLKIHLLDTHGDINYIGLNGIEVYDALGNPLSQTLKPSLAANPSSVRIIPQMSQDPRVVGNLLTLPHETTNDQSMWLAPFMNRYLDANDPLQQCSNLNTLYLGFERAIAIGAIQFWNYSKAPARGTREVAIWLDDLLIYKGYLRISSGEPKEGYNSTAVIFGKQSHLVEKFGNLCYNELDRQQKVILTNEKKGIQQQKSYAILDRPITSAKIIKK